MSRAGFKKGNKYGATFKRKGQKMGQAVLAKKRKKNEEKADAQKS